MTERLDPVRDRADRRQHWRRDEDAPGPGRQRYPGAQGSDPGASTKPAETLPVPAGPATTRDPGGAKPLDGQSAFAAQLLGQPGVKRGLRGGPAVIDAARSAYLEAEYSGPADRRPGKGLLKKAEI
jgi:hypothetical protein